MRNFDISFSENTPVDVLSSKDILLVTKLYDKIRAAMSNESNVEKFVNAVYKYRDKNIDIFSSPYILEMNIFTPQDFRLVWDLLDIDEKEVKKLVKAVKLPGKLTKPKAKPTKRNFTFLRKFLLIKCLNSTWYKIVAKRLPTTITTMAKIINVNKRTIIRASSVINFTVLGSSSIF